MSATPHLKSSVSTLANAHRPCLAMAVTLTPTVDMEGECEASVESTLESVTVSDLATALAAMKYAHALTCQRLADELDMPINTLMNHINEEYNAMQARDLEL